MCSLPIKQRLFNHSCNINILAPLRCLEREHTLTHCLSFSGVYSSRDTSNALFKGPSGQQLS